jgi:uncharacterized membrane protein
MDLLVRRRVLSDYLGGAQWVFPTVSVLGFLTAGALLSQVSVDADSLLWPLAFQGTAEDARGILVVVSATMITVTGLVFALTIVALQIAAGPDTPRLPRNVMRDRGTQVVLGILLASSPSRQPGCTRSGSSVPAGRRSCPAWPCPDRWCSDWSVPGC